MENGNVKVEVTEESLAEYEKERLARLEKFTKDAGKSPTLVKYDWTPPKLNPDGSLAEEAPAKKPEKK